MTTEDRIKILLSGREIYFSALVAIANEELTPSQSNYELLYGERQLLLQMVNFLDNYAGEHIKERKKKFYLED